MEQLFFLYLVNYFLYYFYINILDALFNKNDKFEIELRGDTAEVIKKYISLLLNFVESQTSLEKMKLW